MIRTLSSDATFVNKFLVPPLWLAVMGYVIVSSPLPWLFAAVFGLLIAGLGYALVSLKRVRVEAGVLLVSNYRIEVVVPLADVEQVVEPGVSRPRFVTLRL